MKQTQITPAALVAAASGNIENFIAASTPGRIEAQEKNGQIEQSFLETLPIKGTASCRLVWEKLGFVFGTQADDIFVNVTFPKGWRKKVTDHAMWSELVDDKGRKRGGIFYKAAFYDRRAHVNLEARFSVSSYMDSDETGFFQVSINDCGNVVMVIGKYKSGDYSAVDSLSAKANGWLNQNYPNWKDDSAYWD